MEMRGIMGGLYRVCEWIMRLAYVNLLWILFTFVGLIVLGFIPATTAMFAVTRKWVMGQEDIPVFKTFWQSYKTEFIKSNLLIYLMIIIGYILYIDLRFFQSFEGWMFQVATLGILMVMFMYFITCLYILPIFVHFRLKFFQYIKFAFIFAFSFPLQTITMIAGLVALYFILLSFPGLLPFFSGSTISFVLMWSAYRAFEKNEHRRKAMEEEENEELKEREADRA